MMHVNVQEVPLSDELLAERARAGERGAFDVLVTRYQDVIYRLAVRMSRNPSDAEEIVQEAFLSAHRGIRDFHGDSRFATWLYRIAMNVALMRRRAAARRPTLSLDAVRPRLRDIGQPEPEASDAAELLEQKQVAARVRRALDTLADGHRDALVLRDLEELTGEEAAAILGVSPAVVRQRAHRARVRLRKELRSFMRAHAM